MRGWPTGRPQYPVRDPEVLHQSLFMRHFPMWAHVTRSEASKSIFFYTDDTYGGARCCRKLLNGWLSSATLLLLVVDINDMSMAGLFNSLHVRTIPDIYRKSRPPVKNPLGYQSGARFLIRSSLHHHRPLTLAVPRGCEKGEDFFDLELWWCNCRP